MKPTIQKYLEYMRSVRNSSPHTLVNYGNDLEQFVAFLTPPGTETPELGQVTHHVIREYVRVPLRGNWRLCGRFSSIACGKAG
jgi:site-specific recombinase XerD